MVRLAFAVLFSIGINVAQQPNAGSSIAGHVTNSLSGAPVGKAMVELTRSQGPPDIQLFAATDAAGAFQFTGLPPGAYRLSARRAGFLDRPLRRVITLGQDEHVDKITIRLLPLSVISGRVLDEEGEPEPEASVSISKQVFRNGRRQWVPMKGVPTNDLGEYRVPGLVPGRYILQARLTRRETDNHYSDSDSPAPRAFYYPVYYQNGSTLREALPVDVGLGSDVRGIDIRLFKLRRPPTVRLSGKVVGLSPDSPVTVGVSLIETDEAPWGGGSTSTRAPDYAFELKAPPGQYTLRANVYSGGAEAYGSQELALTGDMEGVALALHPAPVVPVSIVLPDGSGPVKLQGVTATWYHDASNNVYRLRSDSKGKLTALNPVRPGRYTLIVDSPSLPDGFFVQRVTLGGEEIDVRDFRIPASAPLEIVLAKGAGKIAGSVVDKDENRFRRMSTVTLVPADSRLRPEKTSADDTGTFNFTALRPGKYKLFAWEQVDDDLWPDPEFRRRYESLATDVTVGPGETRNAVVRLIAVEEMK